MAVLISNGKQPLPFIRADRNSQLAPRYFFPQWENEWSEGDLFIVPSRRRQFEKRNGIGYRLETTYLKKIIPSCPGLYELAVCRRRKSGYFEVEEVVYVGQTVNLRTRILEYCRSGSHKKEKINEVVDDGYGIAIRYLPLSNLIEAENKEKRVLSGYFYPWNEVYYEYIGNDWYSWHAVDYAVIGDSESENSEDDDSEMSTSDGEY